MKALTLTEPWASLVAIGAKRVETRSWATSYRGPIAIHAAKGMPGYAADCLRDYDNTFLDAFNSARIHPHTGFIVPATEYFDIYDWNFEHAPTTWFMQQTRGRVIATANLLACVQVLARLGGDSGGFDDPMGHWEFRVGFHPLDAMRNRYDALSIGEGTHRPYLGAMYSDQKLHLRRLQVSEVEEKFGDFGQGRWLWLLDNVQAIDPIPAVGALGLWDWDPPAELAGAA